MLLVIGLLVSGVLVGKDMIRAAELRSITTQKDQLQSSVMLFQDKYHGLPGDLKNATAFWGTMMGGTCSNTAAGATTASGTQTCNGDGNGEISNSLVAGGNTEIFLFWQHLSNAGLVEGKYSGISSGSHGIDGQQMKGKIKNTEWHAPYYGIIPPTHTWLFEGDYGNILSFLHNNGGEALTPTEAWGIDKKIDDGLPSFGKMVIAEIAVNVLKCNSTVIAATATYSLDYESAACRPIFKNMW